MHGSWSPTSSKAASFDASNDLNQNAVKPCAFRDRGAAEGGPAGGITASATAAISHWRRKHLLPMTGDVPDYAEIPACFMMPIGSMPKRSRGQPTSAQRTPQRDNRQ